MRLFAELLSSLILTPGRNAKVRALVQFFRTTEDPDRGWALAAVAGTLTLPAAKAATLKAMAMERADPELFALSYDFVGDLAETIALIWPERPGANRPPELSEAIEGLTLATRSAAPGLIAGWLDALDGDGRWALLKLCTGGLRIGAGSRLVKQALAEFGGVEIEQIEEIWHGLTPPYGALFAWLEGRAERPAHAGPLWFRPVMLAHPLEPEDQARLSLSDFAIEWKWDGARVQVVRTAAGDVRIYTRTGEDITPTFPDLAGRLGFEGVLDGELLIRAADGGVAPFNALQQRLNRKTVDAKLLAQYPAFVRAYDLLMDGDTDLRAEPLRARRARLERLVAAAGGPRLDLSPLIVSVPDWVALDALRASPDDPNVEGLMLKRWDSVYEAGRPKGPWWKWKRQPFTADCVLMYAQRGHGKRSSYYSDFTFGVWRGEALTPVGKAYFGFTDEELKQLDKFIRDNTTEKFGPVRAVAQTLVLEIAFDGLQRSTRHKSGLAMRFPRIARIRTDKPAAEADRLETLEALLPG